MDAHKTMAQLRQHNESHLQHARLMTDGTHIAVYEIREVYGRPLAYPVLDLGIVYPLFEDDSHVNQSCWV